MRIIRWKMDDENWCEAEPEDRKKLECDVEEHRVNEEQWLSLSGHESQ
jgi:hypothetical protein